MLFSRPRPVLMDLGGLFGGGGDGGGGGGGGYDNGEAAREAARISAAAMDRATALQEKMYNQTRSDVEPWRVAGGNALARITEGMQPEGELYRSFTMDDFQKDPGYDFRLSEGLKGLERSAAARGGLLSGAALKGISRYGQDYASGEYNNAYNRYNADQGNKFNKLSSVAGYGTSANASNQVAGTNYANNAGNLYMTDATNQGNALLAAQSARQSAYENDQNRNQSSSNALLGLLGQGVGMYFGGPMGGAIGGAIGRSGGGARGG